MDRDVTLRMRFDGSDAERGLRRLGDEADATGRKAQAMQDALFRAEQGVMSGQLPLDVAERATRRLSRRVEDDRVMDYLDPDRVLRGGRSRTPLSVAEEAAQLYERQQRRADVLRQVRVMKGLPEEDIIDATPATLRDRLRGTGLSRLAMPLFLTHAAGQAFAGVGAGLEESAAGYHGFGETMSNVTGKLSESLPVIGGFIRGLESMSNALSGTTSRLHEAREFAATGTRRTASAFEALSARTAGEAQLAGLRQRLTEAGISADVAGDVLAGFNANPGQFANPIAVPGMTTGREGDLQLALLQARAAAAGSEDVARSQGGRVGLAEIELRRRQGVAGTWRGQMVAAERYAEAMEVAAQGVPGGGLAQGIYDWLAPDQRRGLREFRTRGAEARADAGVFAEGLRGAEGAVNQQAKIVQQELTKLEEAQGEAAKRRAEVKQRELDIERNKLALLDQQIARGRGQELRAATMQPGQLEMLAAYAQQAKEHGYLSLPPDARGELISFQGPGAEERARQEVRNNPAMQGLLAQIRGGVGEGLVQDVEGQRKAVEEGVKRGMVENAAQLQKALEGALAGSFRPFVDAVKAGVEAEVGRAAAQLRAELNVGQLQGRR